MPHRTTIGRFHFAQRRDKVPAKFDNARPTMTRYLRYVIPHCVSRTLEMRVVASIAACSCVLTVASALAGLSPLRAYAQQPEPAHPVVVQPGAPGKRTRVLPSTTKAKLPPLSTADVQFMQGMIMHH